MFLSIYGFPEILFNLAAVWFIEYFALTEETAEVELQSWNIEQSHQTVLVTLLRERHIQLPAQQTKSDGNTAVVPWVNFKMLYIHIKTITICKSVSQGH